MFKTDFIAFYLAALGQVMLYVDGMNGVISHNETIQWLYSLTASKVGLNSLVQILYILPIAYKNL